MADESGNVPDFYADQFTMAQSAYGIAFSFNLSPSTPGPMPRQQQSTPQVVVRMSLEHAKIMAMMVRKNLKQYELEHLGDAIKLPRHVLQQMNLSEDDW